MYENDQFDITIFTGAAGDALSLRYPEDVVPMNYKYSKHLGISTPTWLPRTIRWCDGR